MTKFLHFNIPINPHARTSFKKKWQSRTVAAEPLTADEIKALALLFMGPPAPTTCTLNIGVTFLSLQDRYSRAEGRKESIAKMAKTDIAIKGVTVTETHIFVHLASFKGISLSLRANRSSGYSTVVGVLEGVES